MDDFSTPSNPFSVFDRNARQQLPYGKTSSFPGQSVVCRALLSDTLIIKLAIVMDVLLNVDHVIANDVFNKGQALRSTHIRGAVKILAL